MQLQRDFRLDGKGLLSFNKNTSTTQIGDVIRGEHVLRLEVHLDMDIKSGSFSIIVVKTSTQRYFPLRALLGYRHSTRIVHLAAPGLDSNTEGYGCLLCILRPSLIIAQIMPIGGSVRKLLL